MRYINSLRVFTLNLRNICIDFTGFAITLEFKVEFDNICMQNTHEERETRLPSTRKIDPEELASLVELIKRLVIAFTRNNTAFKNFERCTNRPDKSYGLCFPS